MTPEKAEKLMKHGARHSMTPAALGKLLASPPHNLTPVEATVLMDRYRREYPQASAVVAIWNEDCKRLAKKEPPEKQAVRNIRAYKKLLKGGPFPAGAGDTIRTGVDLAAPVKSAALINRSAVKKLALEISKVGRAGVFKRVSGSFIDGVEAELDAVIRGLARNPAGDAAGNYVTGNAIKAARERLNQAVLGIVRGRVHRHPTVGQTLKD